jgi:hypothetical protein
LNDGRANVTLQGEPVKDWFEPGLVYRQVSNEYNALTTLTDKGHRAPRVTGNPDVVFLGDSFTYGYGLTDDEVFASIYCAELRRTCANLGLPGSGTSRQVQRLEQFLTDWRWRPREVKLFFFGMSTSFSAGNDFVDNYNYGRRRQTASADANARESSSHGGIGSRILSLRSTLFEHSNLMRRVKYHWGPALRSVLVDAPGEGRMAQALVHTKQGLQELDDLSRRIGFEYNVYLLVPVQDIIRGTYGDTLATLNRVSPKPAIDTARLFLDSPQNFYYAYDGHLNPRGSRRVAEFLVSLETSKARF